MSDDTSPLGTPASSEDEPRQRARSRGSSVSSGGDSNHEHDLGDFQIGHASEADLDAIQRHYEKHRLSKLVRETSSTDVFDLSSDGLYLMREAISKIAQDDFSKCFESHKRDRWNFNAYLMPAWFMGVITRYFILFPLRLVALILGAFLSLFAFLLVTTFIRDVKVRESYQRFCIQMLATSFVVSWSGVIKYHGARPRRRPNQVFVANHTSLIDVIVLFSVNTFAVVGQEHVGLVGFFQNHILKCLGCLWFDRYARRDRKAVHTAITTHIGDETNNPLLIFPEGTCVNNEYVVQFKKGAFDLGARVYPIAIKYNKIFADAFWNSREQSFLDHLFHLMTGWAVVCDVYYLSPMDREPEESAVQFADRVRHAIADKARLKVTEFDGYMKHVRPSQKYVQAQQKLFANKLLRSMGMHTTTPSSSSSSSSLLHDSAHLTRSVFNPRGLPRNEGDSSSSSSSSSNSNTPFPSLSGKAHDDASGPASASSPAGLRFRSHRSHTTA